MKPLALSVATCLTAPGVQRTGEPLVTALMLQLIQEVWPCERSCDNSSAPGPLHVQSVRGSRAGSPCGSTSHSDLEDVGEAGGVDQHERSEPAKAQYLNSKTIADCQGPLEEALAEQEHEQSHRYCRQLD